MVFEKVAVEGYEALKKAIEGSRARTVILFTGSKDSGKSWCPDCIAVIARVIGELSSSNFANEHDIRFIECSVGSRE
uniref:Thioredoxin domain-containing protein 17 n=1 Tax=Parascaris equorum TaxID=6256 RepID=A0A914S240_PAREQ